MQFAYGLHYLRILVTFFNFLIFFLFILSFFKIQETNINFFSIGSNITKKALSIGITQS